MDTLMDLPSDIKMYILKFVGSPIATLIKGCAPRKYPKKFWIKYEKWVLEWKEYNTSRYEVEYWSMKYHQCCMADIKWELLYGILIKN